VGAASLLVAPVRVHRRIGTLDLCSRTLSILTDLVDRPSKPGTPTDRVAVAAATPSIDRPGQRPRSWARRKSIHACSQIESVSSSALTSRRTSPSPCARFRSRFDLHRSRWCSRRRRLSIGTEILPVLSPRLIHLFINSTALEQHPTLYIYV